MRLPGSHPDCGTLLELGWVTRQLRLSQPVDVGPETIPVRQIIGSVNRSRDFDACWHPTGPRLEQRLREIQAVDPVGMDEPIDVIRLDRAYFVVDGHKRVALANRTGREFLDARVRALRSPYRMTPDVDPDAIVRTAREAEFRRHSGLAEAVPEVRFVLADVDDYGELLEAVQAHAYDLSQRQGRFVPRAEAAADWYHSVYLPTVAEGREAVDDLISPCSDADAFLLVHRQRLAYWGSECDAPGCIAEKLAVPRPEGPLPALSRLIGRRSTSPEPRVLPLATDRDEAAR